MRTHWDLILIEDNIVGEANIVDPLDWVSGTDGDIWGVEHKATSIRSQLDSCGIGTQCKTNWGNADSCCLSKPADKQDRKNKHYPGSPPL